MAVIRDRYELEIDTSRAQRALGGAQTAVRGFIGALAVREVVQFGQAIVDAGSQIQQYQNRLSLVTNSQEELEGVMARLTQVAQANRSSFGETVSLYTSLTTATEALGYDQEQVIGIMTAFQQALAVSGADANTAAGAIRQFGQAMGSGTVRGDEFNSIVEALGPAIGIMARESGLTVGELRDMSQAGELTAETFANMLLNSSALSESFSGMTTTTDQLETALGDAFTRALAKVNELTGASTVYQNVLRGLARDFDAFAGTEGAMVNIEDPTEIVDMAREGTISYADAVAELNARLGDTPRASNLYGLLGDEMETLLALRAEVEALAEADAAAAEERRLAAEATAARTEAARAAAATFEEEANAHDALATSQAAEAESTALVTQQLRDQATVRAEALRQAAEHEMTLAEAREQMIANEQAVTEALNTSRETRAQQMAQEAALLSPLIEQNTLYSSALQGVQYTQTDLTEAVLNGITAHQTAISIESSRLGSLENMRAAMVSAAAAQRELNTAITSQPATRAGGSAGFGNLFSLPTTATAPSTGLTFGRALGGPITGGRGYVVGENGREFIFPQSNGRVVPEDQMGGNVNVNFTVNATDTVGFDSYLNRRRGDIVNLVRQAVQENRGRF